MMTVMRTRNLFPVLVAIAQLRLLAEEPAAIPQPKPKAAEVSFADIGLVEFEAPADAKWVIRYTLDNSTPKAGSYAYCTPIRVASTLKLKAACFGPDGQSGTPVVVECVYKPAERKDTAARQTAAINVDYSDARDIADWAKRAQKDAEEYFSVIAEKLSSEGFTPPRQIMLVFKTNVKLQIAATAGSTITFARSWIKQFPEDTGTVIHELAHVVQAYKKAPRDTGWLVEGIADYIRWWNWEPPEHRKRINPTRVKFKDTYQSAAAFLYWAEKQYDKDLVKKLNKAMRDGSYTDELFKECTHKDLETLWKEWLDSLTK